MQQVAVGGWCFADWSSEMLMASIVEQVIRCCFGHVDLWVRRRFQDLLQVINHLSEQSFCGWVSKVAALEAVASGSIGLFGYCDLRATWLSIYESRFQQSWFGSNFRFLGRVPFLTCSGFLFTSYYAYKPLFSKFRARRLNKKTFRRDLRSWFVLRHWNVCAALERSLFKNELEICFSGFASSSCLVHFLSGCCQPWFEQDIQSVRIAILPRFGVTRACSDLNSLSLVFHICLGGVSVLLLDSTWIVSSKSVLYCFCAISRSGISHFLCSWICCICGHNLVYLH